MTILRDLIEGLDRPVISGGLDVEWPGWPMTPAW